MLNSLPSHLLRLFLYAIISTSTLLAMEQRSLPRPVSGDITDIAWTPRGSRVAVALKTKKSVQIFGDELNLETMFNTGAPVRKLVSSSAQHALAAGLSNGTLEIFSCHENAVELTATISTKYKEIHELCWIGDSAYILVYFKDREPHVAGTNTFYRNASTLRIFDSRTGTFVKEFTLPNHVLKIDIAPSGKTVAIVTDLHNRREPALSLEEKGILQELQLYSLSDTLEAKPLMQTPYNLESSISCLTWSPDSANVAALLDNGDLQIFDLHGKTH